MFAVIASGGAISVRASVTIPTENGAVQSVRFQLLKGITTLIVVRFHHHLSDPNTQLYYYVKCALLSST